MTDIYQRTFDAIDKRIRLLTQMNTIAKEKNYPYMNLFSEEINGTELHTARYYSEHEAINLLEEVVLDD